MDFFTRWETPVPQGNGKDQLQVLSVSRRCLSVFGNDARLGKVDPEMRRRFVV